MLMNIGQLNDLYRYISVISVSVTSSHIADSTYKHVHHGLTLPATTCIPTLPVTIILIMFCCV